MNETDRDRLCSPSLATKQARRLIGCYRKGECEDPEVYVPAVATVLAAYPEDVVLTVTDPLRGVPGTVKWLPTIAEVKAACDAEMAPRLAQLAKEWRERDLRKMIAGPPPSTEEERARAVAHWENTVRPVLELRDISKGVPKETTREALARLKSAPLPSLSDEVMAKIRGKAA